MFRQEDFQSGNQRCIKPKENQEEQEDRKEELSRSFCLGSLCKIVSALGSICKVVGALGSCILFLLKHLKSSKC